MRAAASRSSSKPKVIQASAVRATGHSSAGSSSTSSRHLPARRTLDRRPGDLAVALRTVRVTDREERAVDRDREEQRRPGDELLAVDVPAPAPRRHRRVHARLGRRHADARRRTAAAAPRSRRRAPRRPPSCHSRTCCWSGVSVDAPRPGLDRLDAHGQRLARPRAAHLDRAGERVAVVELGVARLEEAALVELPAGVRDVDAHGVAGVDRRAPARGRARSARAACAARAGARGSLQQPANRVRDALDRGHVRVLDLPVRVRHVVAGHAQHRARAGRRSPSRR